ncbi:MAG: 4Fe-4S dicluster domain-containing protein [Anaerolineae bacterium]|jgi:Fe-S-cluster-containing dehydrogenase component
MGQNHDGQAPGSRPDANTSPAATGPSRRTVLKAGLSGGLLLATGAGWISLSQALSEAQSEYVLILDLNKCMGCRVCEKACNQRNQLPEDQSFIHVLARGEGQARWYLPIQCQHCRKAPCEQVCPAKATYHHPSGVVLVSKQVCVGCKYCSVACPYNARIYDEHAGIVNKCWLCLDWVLGGGQPACVQACLKGARIFGRRGDTHIARLLASGRAQPLHPELGTEPGIVRYIFPGT